MIFVNEKTNSNGELFLNRSVIEHDILHSNIKQRTFITNLTTFMHNVIKLMSY